MRMCFLFFFKAIQSWDVHHATDKPSDVEKQIREAKTNFREKKNKIKKRKAKEIFLVREKAGIYSDTVVDWTLKITLVLFGDGIPSGLSLE